MTYIYETNHQNKMLSGFSIIMILCKCLKLVFGEAIKGCTLHPEAYIADSRDICVYFRCVHGTLTGPLPCAQGTGVPKGYFGVENPCMRITSVCAGEGVVNLQIESNLLMAAGKWVLCHSCSKLHIFSLWQGLE